MSDTVTVTVGSTKYTLKEYRDLICKETDIKTAETNIIINKLKVLEELLSSTRPTNVAGLSDTIWNPSITDDVTIQAIDNKILELVKKL